MIGDDEHLQDTYSESWNNPTHPEYDFYHGDLNHHLHEDPSEKSHIRATDSERTLFRLGLVVVSLSITGVILMRFLYY